VKRLVRLYPRRWRDRYGREMSDLLSASERPWRDGLNIAAYAVLAWLEVPLFRAIVTVVAAGSLVMFGFTVGQLADGVSEIPEHWWSSASASVAIVAVATALISFTRTSKPDNA
jgi:hypothetical protein